MICVNIIRDRESSYLEYVEYYRNIRSGGIEMDTKKIMSIIRRQEGLKLDFKLRLTLDYESGKKELAKDICAIANSKGGRGYMVVGIEDKTREIIGLKEEDLFSEEKIQQIVSSRCDPPIPISVDIYTIKEKDICIITIYDGGQKPYQIKETGAFYIRRGSTTDIMRKQELIAVFEENLDFSIETCPIIRSNIEFLNMEIVKKYFNKKGIDINEDNRKFLLESAGITSCDRDSGEERCTLGGLLVFSDNNSVALPQNMIRIVNKVDEQRENINIVQGNLITMIEKTEGILKEILPSEYPVNVVMEGVNNAVLYREYSSINRVIDITISNSSIIITSPGQRIENNIRGQRVNYYKRNMWLYEKLITLDDNKNFLNNERGFTKMRKAFGGKIKLVNSRGDDSFKVILPGIRFFKYN